MIDMGMSHGKHVFLVPGHKSYGEMIRDGDILAIPDPIQGIIYKRPEVATEIEKRAAMTLEEATKFTEAWNKGIEESNGR
jgi:hypothetical protein